MYIASGRTGRAGREGNAFNLVVGKEVYKLREIQRYCKTRIIPQAIPSLDDVTSIKADKILDQVGEVLQDSDLSKVIDIVEKRVLEEDYTTLDLAAALLKMMMGEEGEELLEENRRCVSWRISRMRAAAAVVEETAEEAVAEMRT